ncbi:MAG: zinc metalloprotease [Capsulimonadales bacterium]|nr:zinc metalloprotease [Capsulimonadales bacterium]
MRSLFSVYSILGGLMLSGVALSLATSPARSQKRSVVLCGTYNPTPAEAQQIESRTKTLLTKLKLSKGVAAAPALANIDVYVHVITRADGTTGNVTDENIQKLVDVLNDGFAGNYKLPDGVTPLGPNANTRFRFTLKGIDRTANDTWYGDGNTYAMKSALRKGDARTLNIYLCSIIPNGLVGYAVFPWWYKNDPIGDGVVYDNTAMPGSGGFYQSGRVLTHEVGHWAGLYHTFQGGCSKYNDYVGDTNAESSPFRGDWFSGGRSPASQPDTCTGRNYPGKDPTDNQMDYSDDTSRVRFTAAQANRMSELCRIYRGL